MPFVKRTNLANFTIQKLTKIKKINKIFILTDSKNYKKKIINHSKVDKGYIRNKKFSTSNSIINNLIDDFFVNYYKNQQNKKIFNFTSDLTNNIN